jgi:hypothetical protein
MRTFNSLATNNHDATMFKLKIYMDKDRPKNHKDKCSNKTKKSMFDISMKTCKSMTTKKQM